jgi:hypothetical protein
MCRSIFLTHLWCNATIKRSIVFTAGVGRVKAAGAASPLENAAILGCGLSPAICENDPGPIYFTYSAITRNLWRKELRLEALCSDALLLA